MNKKILLFIERVVLNTRQNQGYSLPDIITDNKDAQTLINIIENDSELFKMAYAVDPGYNQFKAADIWEKIQQYPEGKAIANKYKDALHFRISSSRTRGAGFDEEAYPQQRAGDPKSTRPIDAFDKKANAASTDIGSFYDFFTDSKKRPQEVSGGAPAQRPPQ